MQDNTAVKPFKSSFGNNIRALDSGGAIVTYLATSATTNGAYGMFEAKGVQGMEPPPHTHTREDETYYLLEGEMWFKVGDEEFTAKKGDFIFLPKNVQHEFKILSHSFHCLVSYFPANLDEYFYEISTPYDSEDIPPASSEPPPPEAMEQIMKLNEQYGILM